MYFLYKKPSDSYIYDYEIHRFSPKIFHLKIKSGEELSLKSRLVRLLFIFLSKGKLLIYYVEDNGKLIHTSYVMPACRKFPFIKKGEYEIGPCYTHSDYRGRGIYPTVLQTIVSDKKDTVFHMLVAEENHSSIRGIEKAGFAYAGKAYVTPLKRYKVLQKNYE